MYLVVGLGNTGNGYAKHRHNIGFQVVDLLAARHSMRFDRNEQQAKVAAGTIAARKVMLAKPQTMMNNSGRAVAGLMRYYKIALDNLIVVVDDLDLPEGQIRLRSQGGSAGQNGMKSVIEHVGSEEFSRLRVGIGRPPGRMDPAAYVLQNFSAEQETEFAIVRQEAADAIEAWLAEGIVAAMNRFNRREQS